MFKNVLTELLVCQITGEWASSMKTSGAAGFSVQYCLDLGIDW